jgi:hypothetical protein
VGFSVLGSTGVRADAGVAIATVRTRPPVTARMSRRYGDPECRSHALIRTSGQPEGATRPDQRVRFLGQRL